MNPPQKEDGRPRIYINHIYMALEMLKEGGVLFSLVPGNMTSDKDKQTVALCDTVEKHGCFWLLPSEALVFEGKKTNYSMIQITKWYPYRSASPVKEKTNGDKS